MQLLKDEDFKRSTGVQGATFRKMLEVVETGLGKFGRPIPDDLDVLERILD